MSEFVNFLKFKQMLKNIRIAYVESWTVALKP